MGRNALTVKVNCASVAHRTEIEIQFLSGRNAVGREVSGIPHGTFIVLELRELAVKIAWNVKPESSVERILEKLVRFRGLAVLPDLFPPALVIKVNDGVPFAVQQLEITPIDIDHKVGIAVGFFVAGIQRKRCRAYQNGRSGKIHKFHLTIFHIYTMQRYSRKEG